MLKKLKKLLIIVVVIAGVGYVSFLVFVNPAGFVDKEELINSYFDNIKSDDLCDNHFNPETKDFCISFTNLMDSRVIEVIDLTINGDNYVVTISIDGTEGEFDITFIEIEVTGLKSFLNKTYYKIDLIT